MEIFASIRCGIHCAVIRVSKKLSLHWRRLNRTDSHELFLWLVRDQQPCAEGTRRAERNTDCHDSPETGHKRIVDQGGQFGPRFRVEVVRPGDAGELASAF